MRKSLYEVEYHGRSKRVYGAPLLFVVGCGVSGGLIQVREAKASLNLFKSVGSCVSGSVRAVFSIDFKATRECFR